MARQTPNLGRPPDCPAAVAAPHRLAAAGRCPQRPAGHGGSKPGGRLRPAAGRPQTRVAAAAAAAAGSAAGQPQTAAMAGQFQRPPGPDQRGRPAQSRCPGHCPAALLQRPGALVGSPAANLAGRSAPGRQPGPGPALAGGGAGPAGLARQAAGGPLGRSGDRSWSKGSRLSCARNNGHGNNGHGNSHGWPLRTGSGPPAEPAPARWCAFGAGQ